MSNRERLRSLLYGFAVGDALGVPYEFRDRDTFECSGMVGGGTWGQPAGTWSDDTSMTLATCESIIECGGIDVEDMRRRFEAWAFEGAYTCEDSGRFDIGNTTIRALEMGRGMTAESSCGNGSLMRILPLALMPEVSNAQVFGVSAITHAHKRCELECLGMVAYAHRVVDGDVPADNMVPRDKIESGGYVCDTSRAARWCLETSQSYGESVLKAVNLGGDTDTTAAITGGLAGLRWGYGAIPAEWVESLRGRDQIESIIERRPY